MFFLCEPGTSAFPQSRVCSVTTTTSGTSRCTSCGLDATCGLPPASAMDLLTPVSQLPLHVNQSSPLVILVRRVEAGVYQVFAN
jgi:hypothetical protein